MMVPKTRDATIEVEPVRANDALCGVPEGRTQRLTCYRV